MDKSKERHTKKYTFPGTKECHILATASSLEGQDHVWSQDTWNQKDRQRALSQVLGRPLKELRLHSLRRGGSWRRSVGNDTSDTNFGKTNCYQFGEHIKGTGDHRHKDCSAGHWSLDKNGDSLDKVSQENNKRKHILWHRLQEEGFGDQLNQDFVISVKKKNKPT